MALLGYPRVHRICTETRAPERGTPMPNSCLDTLPRTRVSLESIGHHRKLKSLQGVSWFAYDAQAACAFS